MQSTPRVIVVSIHDVSPLTWRAVREILSDLSAIGVGRTSLLVIPDHHGKALLSRHEGFCSWLKDTVDAGHEPVLHGFYHLRERAAKEGALDRMVTRIYTAGEGEFYDIGEPDARERLRAGRALLSEAGAPPVGFIAPAWLLGADGERAVRGEGFDYTTRIGGVLDLRSGETFPARSLVYSVRAGWRRSASLVWNAALSARLRRRPLLRMGIHPPDWDHPAIRSQILRLVSGALAGRDAMTYEGWLASRRAQS